jgi:hypothetical protein
MTTKSEDAILPRAIKVNREEGKSKFSEAKADKKSKERIRKVFIVV